MGQPTMLFCGAACGGGAWEGTMLLAQLSPSFPSLPPLPISRLSPFRCWFLGGWVCVHARTLWVSLMTSAVRLGVSPTATIPTGFYSQRFLRLYFSILEPWVVRFVLLLSYSSCFIPMWMWDHRAHQPPPYLMFSLPRLPVPTPPTGLDEYFFFNFLVVRLPYSLIFWQFWLFFVFKFVVVFLAVWRSVTTYASILVGSTMWQFDICMCCEMIVTINLVNTSISSRGLCVCMFVRKNF